jgi:hypothetical protein
MNAVLIEIAEKGFAIPGGYLCSPDPAAVGIPPRPRWRHGRTPVTPMELPIEVEIGSALRAPEAGACGRSCPALRTRSAFVARRTTPPRL